MEKRFVIKATIATLLVAAICLLSYFYENFYEVFINFMLGILCLGTVAVVWMIFYVAFEAWEDSSYNSEDYLN